MKRILNLSTYNVIIDDIVSSLGKYLVDKSYTKTCILVDENSYEYCLPRINGVLTDPIIIRIESGELNKSLSTCEMIWTQMAEHKIDRHSLMINLGGGVIGDMGGFVASCFMRGIDFVQIPTTLLSQVDASVGGKLAIDFKGFKNLIGLFQNPKTVLIDTTFLETLSQAQMRSGFAEMIKHGLISDSTIWERLTSSDNWKDHQWNAEVYASVGVKRGVVQQDPRESGLRKILNFGHTIGHAIESLALETSSPLLHGEAIAIGMMAEAVLSNTLTGLGDQKTQEIISKIRNIYDDIDISILNNEQEIIELMLSDKKNKGGNILFSLLTEIGTCSYDISASDEDIIDCLRKTHSFLSEA